MPAPMQNAMIIETCPRCGSRQVTLDIFSSVKALRDDRRFWAFCRCRSCFEPSIFDLFDQYMSGFPSGSDRNGTVVNGLYEITVSKPVLADSFKCPDFVDDSIKAIFDESSTCFAIGTFDASGAMSRKVLDAATRALVKVEPGGEKTDVNHISWKTYKDLRLRLDWLFDRALLPEDLRDLASCVHQDGNDAAHSMETIGREAALDLIEFTISILETLYTRPGRIKANKERRDARRAGA